MPGWRRGLDVNSRQEEAKELPGERALRLTRRHRRDQDRGESCGITRKAGTEGGTKGVKERSGLGPLSPYSALSVFFFQSAERRDGVSAKSGG